MTPGDVVLLRPGVWHAYEGCDRLEVYDCCFSSQLGRAAAPVIAADDVAQRRPHPAVRRAMRLLESDLARQWTLSDLAEELHLAPAYLVRLFKDATGLPPKPYLAQVRAQRAAVLLLHSDDPVTAIGLMVGWPDANYFARRFKHHYGLGATTYRKRFAAKAAHPLEARV
ncbi:helix-turn-helix transcriptional regulator [Trebonia kvetii]|uniref:helix-turn-helix transcriptional regulator n=1 Tax=Trebonia kvetii TaxID=2480626 RepID=UPI001C9E47D6|nr:AraC family transcriptional regulator [Trebonia kvetii]